MVTPSGVANAIINKINSLISSHNSNGNAHQDIRNSIPKIFYVACDCSEQNELIELECEDWNTEQGNIIYVRFNNVDNHDSTHVMFLNINEEPIPVHNTIDFYNTTPLTLFRDVVVKFTCYFIDENTPIFLYEFSTLTSELYNDSGYLTAHQDITGKEDKSNKVTSLSSSSTDTEYPSAKAVFNSLANYVQKSQTNGLLKNDGSIVESISIEDTDLFDVLDCINNNFDNFNGYIFYDGGVTENVNTNYVKSHTGVSASVSSNGTTVSSTTYADCFYIANVLLPNDWIAEFTIVSVTAFGGIGFLNSDKEFQWHVEYNLLDSPKSFQFREGEITETISNDYTLPSTIKLIKEGTSLEIYLNGTLISTKTITDMTGYLGWKTHKSGSRSVTFKEFKVEAL